MEHLYRKQIENVIHSYYVRTHTHGAGVYKYDVFIGSTHLLCARLYDMKWTHNYCFQNDRGVLDEDIRWVIEWIIISEGGRS